MRTDKKETTYHARTHNTLVPVYEVHIYRASVFLWLLPDGELGVRAKIAKMWFKEIQVDPS